jgi:hypothetical protein
MTFRVGQKVVCINDKEIHGGFWAAGARPVAGAVYTITEIIPGAYGDYQALRFSEIRNAGDIGYRSSRFRPVAERKTDISFAHEILRKASKPARVR